MFGGLAKAQYTNIGFIRLKKFIMKSLIFQVNNIFGSNYVRRTRNFQGKLYSKAMHKLCGLDI